MSISKLSSFFNVNSVAKIKLAMYFMWHGNNKNYDLCRLLTLNLSLVGVRIPNLQWIDHSYNFTLTLLEIKLAFKSIIT